MGFFRNLISTLATGVNYFNRDEYGNVATDHERVPTVILSQCSDCKGRPDAIVQASSYRDVPNFGTWDGTQVHTRIGENTWHVHYEDYHV